MGEKWNSGIGGYVCDHCRVLLWAGFGGLDEGGKRHYYPSARKDYIVIVGGKAYCSIACAYASHEEE